MTNTEEILRTLVAFKTTEDNPGEIKKGFAHIASLFDTSIFEIQDIEYNMKYSQLISFKGNNALRPRILLNGHLDVVKADDETQYSMTVENGRAFGRGTADMKGMLSVLIQTMIELGKQKPCLDVALLTTGDEEVGGECGVGHIVRNVGLRPEFVICADGSQSDQMQITIREKGGLWIELEAKGKTAHAAYLWRGENAIEKLWVAIEKIKRYIGEIEPESWKTTCNLAWIETSNRTSNKVPGDARAVLDIRFTEQIAKSPDELLEKIKQLVPEVLVRPLERAAGLFLDEQNPFLVEFRKVAERVSGKMVPLVFEHGATDARYFGEQGVPSLIIGVIGGGMHATNEWVDMKSLEQRKEILLAFLKNA